jgi:hypothetical protein
MTNSFNSYESPAQSFLFDLDSTDLTDLASDFNEFNDFYKNDNQYTKIERPQNPFYKNFRDYQQDDEKASSSGQRNSFSTFDLGSLLTAQEPENQESLALKKQSSLSGLASFGSSI